MGKIIATDLQKFVSLIKTKFRLENYLYLVWYWQYSKTGSKTNFGPCLGTKSRFLSFNRTQSRVVTGLLSGHNNQRNHLYLMGL
jgi:hypothetical protein